jgi:hypothetical protein
MERIEVGEAVERRGKRGMGSLVTGDKKTRLKAGFE